MKSLTSFSLLVLSTVLLSTTHLFAQGEDLTVYDEVLYSPWINNSWSASVDFNSTEQAQSGSNSIKVALTSTWGALSLHYGNWGSQGVDPADYQNLEFAAHGGTTGTRVSVFFENDDGQSFPSVSYDVLANQWTTISATIAQLNPNNQEINRISIQDISGSIRTFYIDEMQLIGVPTTPPPSEGWVAQSSGTTQSLFAVSFVDQNVGTVVGANGTILRTTDGGTTWTPQQSGTSVDLNGVSFTDANTGTVVGGGFTGAPGVILRTTDGGTTWVEQSTEYGASALFGVSFADTNNGLAVGGGDFLHRTTDGGATWLSTFYYSGVELWGVSLPDANTGFVVGGGPNGYIFRTTDGGANWQHADSAYFGTAETYGGVSFSDAYNGFIVSIDGTIVHTTDGGESFTFNKDVTSQVLYSVSSPTSSHAFAVGDAGSIFRTTDGGVTWTTLSSGTSVQLRGVSFVDANTGTAVGENGTILRTVDGGGAASSPPPPAPILAEPANGDTVVTQYWGLLALSWNPSNGATSYTVQVADNMSFTTPFEASGLTETSYNYNTENQSPGTRYWRVSATNASGTSEWSEVQSFYFTWPPPSAPILASPANGATGVSTSPELAWEPPGGTEPITHNLQVSTEATFASLVYEEDLIQPSRNSTIVNDLSNSITYYWRMRAQGQSGTSDWSDIWSFTTEAPAPPPSEGWVAQSSGTSNHLRGVSFVNSDVGIVVGHSGTILKTTNGGEIWTAKSSGTTTILTAVHFTDPSTATAVGAGGIILRTTDGGESWSQQTSNTTVDLYGVEFTDALHGIAVGGPSLGNFNTAVILRTTNGGANWTQVSHPSYPLFAMDFISTNTGWAVGRYGTILKTTDGGASWSTTQSPTQYYLVSVSFVDSLHGWAMHSQGMLRTTDGGSTWTSQLIEFGQNLSDILFTDTNNGTIVGWSGTILSTTDGGTTWTSQPSAVTSQNLQAVTFIDANTGIAVGDGGTILQGPAEIPPPPPADGWVAESSGTSNVLNDIAFSGNAGTAVGVGGTIVRTVDGGVTWTQQSSGTTESLADVSLTNSQTGVAVGTGGIIIRTSNGGQTWSQQTSGTTETLWGIDFANQQIGYAVGAPGLGGLGSSVILKTTDGGSSWQQLSLNSYPLFGVDFLNANVGWVVGRFGTIFKTTDGGASWVSQNITPGYYLTRVSFVDNLNGWVMHSQGILRTTDGGTTWTPLVVDVNQNLSSLVFTDANTGTVVGDNGSIQRTTNGGDQWMFQSSGTSQHLRGVTFADANIGVIVGAGGTILRTTNGGGPAAPYPDLIVYDDALQSPWINASWSSTVTYGSTEQTYDTSASSIKVVANSWGALSVHHGNWGSQGIDPAQYQSVNVALYSTNTGTFYVKLGNDQGDSFPSVGNNIDPNNWVVVSIPMSQLNPNGLVFHRLSIQKSTSGTFYADELRLIGAPQASASSEGLAENRTGLEAEIPSEFSLSQNYPNPFNPVTNIRYQLPEPSTVTLKVYNLLGQEVATLVNGQVPAGYHLAVLTADQLASGMYIYRIQALGENGTSFVQNQRMILLK